MPDGGAEKLLKLSLDSFREEYAELSETWRHLDSKAQGTASMTGIFVGGLFAVLKLNPPSLTVWISILLVTAIGTLSLAAVLSLIASFVRQVPAAPRGDALHELVEDLLDPKNEHELEERTSTLPHDVIRMWREANAAVHTANLWKATVLAWAQRVLLLGIAVTATLMTTLLLHR
jgi:uncharacterized protein involved in cysteine biosynthesis